MGFCQKIYRFELIDWLEGNGRSKDLWNRMLACCTCSKDSHNEAHDGTVDKQIENSTNGNIYSDWLKFSPEMAYKVMLLEKPFETL